MKNTQRNNVPGYGRRRKPLIVKPFHIIGKIRYAQRQKIPIRHPEIKSFQIPTVGQNGILRKMTFAG